MVATATIYLFLLQPPPRFISSAIDGISLVPLSTGSGVENHLDLDILHTRWSSL